MKYYVTMTDKFMSGWGPAKNKINKLVIQCDTFNEAETVATNAKDRGEMIFINITTRRPRYNQDKYYVSWASKDTYKTWFEPTRPFYHPRGD